MSKFLIYGSKGWIGTQFIDYLQINHPEITIIESSVRLTMATTADVENEISQHQPDRVFSFVARTSGPGCPNISYLDKTEAYPVNLQDNLFSPLLLGIICKKYNIHYTYIGTGCIYNGYPDGGYTEDDIPNYTGNTYSTTKAVTDQLLSLLDNTLIFRIRLPVNYKNDNRNLLTKLVKFITVSTSKNSLTVLPTIFPVIVSASISKEIGAFNLCNPGTITFPEILRKINECTNLNLQWEEVDTPNVSNRSNTHLCTKRLEETYPDIPNIEDAIDIAIRHTFI